MAPATSPQHLQPCRSTLPFAIRPIPGNNVTLPDIDINAGTISSGTLALDASSASTRPTSLRLPRRLHGRPGGPLTVAPNVPVLIQPSQTLTVNGTANFAAGDTVTIRRVGQLLHLAAGHHPGNSSGGGTLNAVGTSFAATGVGNIIVGAGGQLTASGSTFASPRCRWTTPA